jgi:hypothetical protein
MGDRRPDGTWDLLPADSSAIWAVVVPSASASADGSGAATDSAADCPAGYTTTNAATYANTAAFAAHAADNYRAAPDTTTHADASPLRGADGFAPSGPASA